jgi:hypothetical protein
MLHVSVCVFCRGGRTLTITGTNLGFIQEPKMFAFVPMDGGEFYPTESTVSLYSEKKNCNRNNRLCCVNYINVYVKSSQVYSKYIKLLCRRKKQSLTVVKDCRSSVKMK